MLSGIKFYFELLTLWHFTSMKRVMLKDMTTLEDEAKIERESGSEKDCLLKVTVC